MGTPTLPRRLARHGMAALRGFAADCRGSISVESALLLPMLLWAYVASFVFFDVFRTENTNAKAAYAVADTLSRRVEPVSRGYIDGLHDLYDALTNTRHPTRMRVSSLHWDIEAERYRLRWSHASRQGLALTEEALNAMAARLPMLAQGETLILVEMGMSYSPPLRIGIGPRELDHLIPMRPRFAPRLCLESCGVGS